MYALGAHLIETFADMTYAEFVKERIFKVLNMTSTTFSPEEAAHGGKLSQSWDNHGRRIPFWFSNEALRVMAGPAGILSSVEDMVC